MSERDVTVNAGWLGMVTFQGLGGGAGCTAYSTGPVLVRPEAVSAVAAKTVLDQDLNDRAATELVVGGVAYLVDHSVEDVAERLANAAAGL